MGQPVVGAHVDIAPFAERRSWDGGTDTGLQWAEVRDLESVTVQWRGAPPRPEDVCVQYWRKDWPQKRAPQGKRSGGGGWYLEGDWYNGSWQTADVRLEQEGGRWTYTFAPVNEKEYPAIADFDATWRSTLKVRLVGKEPLPEADLEARCLSTWSTVDVAVEWGGTAEGPQVWDGRVEAYNGRVENVRPLSGGTVSVDGTTWRSSVDGATEGVTFTARYAVNQDQNTADRTVVTIRAHHHSFSFSVEDLAEGPLLIADYGVLVSRAEDNVTLEGYQASLADAPKTFYDRVFDEDEQTLPRAWGDMPLKQPLYMPLGVEGRRQRFSALPDGSISRPDPRHWMQRVPGRDTARCEGDWGRITWSFGLPTMPFTSRLPLRGYLPIHTASWETGGVCYEQTAFAYPLSADAGALDVNNPGCSGDDTVVALVGIVLTNTGSSRQTVRLRLSTHHDGHEPLAMTEGDVVRTEGGVVRAVLALPLDVRTDVRGGAVRFAADLDPGEQRLLSFKLPFFGLNDEETTLLRAIGFEASLLRAMDYWEERVSSGTQILTPEPLINDYYRAHVAHMLINHERHVDAPEDVLRTGKGTNLQRSAEGPMDVARVGSFSYAAYANESIMQISDLDRRGFHKEAERGYELWLRYQSTVTLNGDFSSGEGCFYGAGGYECGDYNQHHGWVLWGLADHYFATGDRAWLDRVAPKAVAGVDWVARERRRTMRTDATGKRVLEYGFLPAGVLEDILDFWFWLSTNAHTWWGIDRLADALAEVGHPEAERVRAEADAMKADLLAGFEESMIRTAVVRLKDGTAVPHVPSHLHTRGRSFGWIRETLEGAIHLIHTRMIPADSPLATWVLKDLEDNLYISEHYGYSGLSVPDVERYWFSRGGFSQQPNLLCGPLPYLYRDETKHFLRAYFNSFASAFHADTRMMTEHPLPELGLFMGDHYKTSDEAQNTYWLRLMFVYEDGDVLRLGHGIPRYWLADGEKASITDGRTTFGNVTLSVTSETARGRIVAEIRLPQGDRAPARSTLRLRHPKSAPLMSVTVNDAPWDGFDAASETVLLPAGTSLRVVATYQS